LQPAFFYSWGAPLGAIILIVSSAIDYFCSRLLAPGREKYRKLVLAALLAETSGYYFISSI